MLATAVAGFVALLTAALMPSTPAAAVTPQQALAAALAGQYTCTMADRTGGGFTLTCDPPAASPSPTVSPSATSSPSPSPTPTGDRTPPSTPTGLVATPRSTSSILVTWAASTDNVGVTGYVVERGTTVLGTTVTPDWLDTGLTADTEYTYRVRARDAAGNLSAYSAVLSARTQANPAPGNQCQANPSVCGFPDAVSTGATAATTTLNGNQTFSTAGAVIANMRINGCVEVRAANVTFRNVFVNGPGCFWVVQNFSTGLQVIDSTITGGGGNGTCIGSSGLSLLRVELTGCENGLNVSGTTTVTDSWMHDLTTANGAHTDGAQFNQGASDILFQHNTIVMPTPGSTSAIIMWDEGGAQNARVTIASNLLAGGTYSVYCGREGAVDNVRITGNRFGTFQYGYANACNSGEAWSANVRDSDGAALAAQ
jgi:chitodextrinase